MEDTHLGNGKRRVVVAPQGGRGAAPVLAEAVSEARLDRVGDETGSRVFPFLETDDFHRDHTRMIPAGVHLRERAREESCSIVARFDDLYGNRWDLIQRHEPMGR